MGTRRELFVDDFLVEKLSGEARFKQHKPRPENVVLTNDKPWEDGACAYLSVLQDGKLFRMYYRGMYRYNGEPTCYAESNDGIAWKKPALKFFSIEGNDENNIVMLNKLNTATPEWKGKMENYNWRSDFVPFIDRKPGTPENSRYKTLMRGARSYLKDGVKISEHGMYPCESSDALNWKQLSREAVITKGMFDSQNLGFYDEVHKRYVAFIRDTHGLKKSPGIDEERDWKGNICRDIRMSVSEDFIHWSEPVYLKYSDGKNEEMYTNAIMVYERAPHLLLGFPTRFGKKSRTEPIFMVSRDGGESFYRWPEAVIPTDAPSERDGNRSNYMGQGLLQGNDRELFAYAFEGYHLDKKGAPGRIRRFVWRTDGFVSIASEKKGEILTKPSRFSGDELSCNYIAGKGGSMKVELCDIDGKALTGKSLSECTPMNGDAIEETVKWTSGPSLSAYSGQPVRLRFYLENAEVFAFHFIKSADKKQ